MSNEHKDMTVAELHAALTKFIEEHPESKDLTVYLQGCDCSGRWDGRIEIETCSRYNETTKKYEPLLDVYLGRTDL